MGGEGCAQEPPLPSAPEHSSRAGKRSCGEPVCSSPARELVGSAGGDSQRQKGRTCSPGELPAPRLSSQTCSGA